MKINIAATHRFHLLDLARELTEQGHDVMFYSYVPTKRCKKLGLDSNNCHSFWWLVLPFLLLTKIFRKRPKWQYRINRVRNKVIDFYVSKTMRECEIFIALGCIYTHSMIKAKKSWNAITILEWGSKHIIEQLKNFGKLETYPKSQLESDLNEYMICDYISIASTHVKISFLKHNVEEKKLLVNPYGVNLSQFVPTEYTGEFDLIAVGGWRYEKGADLLTELCKQYNYRLLHVGTLVNSEFPDMPNMFHHEPVDQSELVNFYAKAKVFVLPSRSEGLSLVQAQAIACGLPIVCTTETGGIDLAKHNSIAPYVFEMKSISVESLHTCVEKALSLAETQSGKRNYAGDGLYTLSWKAYGERYSSNIMNITRK